MVFRMKPTEEEIREIMNRAHERVMADDTNECIPELYQRFTAEEAFKAIEMATIPTKKQEEYEATAPTTLKCLNCGKVNKRCKHCEDWDSDTDATFVHITHCTECGVTMRIAGSGDECGRV
jgi:hypothetical protein